ncbi:hypothetical protein ACFE04_001672 [Oxalis oulophora]
MAAGTEQDIKFSDKKIEAVEENMKTVDCLRGRLVAERQASKAAKEESELIGNKLIELENKLKEETKLREKADKKLQFLLKKLQSLNIDYGLDNSISLESSTLSNNSSNNSGCSSTSCPQFQPKTPNIDHYSIYTSNSNSNSNSSSVFEPDPIRNPNANTKESSSEVNSDSNSSNPSCKDSKTDGYSFTLSMKNSSTNESDNEEDKSVDNSLALVPVSWPPPTTTATCRIEPEIIDKNVGEALNALRLARESIQLCIERRHMIRAVGPSSKLSTLSS